MYIGIMYECYYVRFFFHRNRQIHFIDTPSLDSHDTWRKAFQSKCIQRTLKIKPATVPKHQTTIGHTVTPENHNNNSLIRESFNKFIIILYSVSEDNNLCIWRIILGPEERNKASKSQQINNTLIGFINYLLYNLITHRYIHPYEW